MPIKSETLADIATRIPGASKIFFYHQLDLCQQADQLLGRLLQSAACNESLLLEDLKNIEAVKTQRHEWRAFDNARFTEHLVEEYHQRHRKQMPELIRLASHAETHHNRTGHLRGTSQKLRNLFEALEQHMTCEEQELFPLIHEQSQNRFHSALAARRFQDECAEELQCKLAAQQFKHGEHELALTALEKLVNKPLARHSVDCGLERALYAELRRFITQLREHIYLEEHILFPRLRVNSYG